MADRRRSPFFAALLSFFIAGLGQLYLGLLVRGASFFVLEVFTAALIKANLMLGLFLNFLVSVWAAFDAYTQAKELNKKVLPEKAKEEEKIKIY